jgi:photosystem II stability/assembly factor-like uncharacterized protein
VWYPPAAGSNPPDRIYATTGYRDYLWFSAADLLALLEQRGYPMDRVFLRESDMGHELYGWHFEELWAWLDRGQRPAEGTLAPGWARDPGFLWPSSLVELAAAADGGVVAAGADGALYRRETSGTWAETGRMPGITFAGVCLLPSGLGVAVGEQAAAVTDDHGATWTAGTPPPGLEEGFFDPAYVNGVACDEGSRVVAVGYWAGLVSDTSGTSWAAAALPTDFGVTAQAAGVTRSPGGTWLAMGYYDYVGRSTDGVSFSSIDTPNDREWYTAAAAHGSRWTLVGEGGAILLSLDDGLTWAEVPAPREDDLYAVAYADAQTGLAVGAHGAAHLTRDGGSSWTDVSSGLDVFLGDVVFLTPTTALAAGERGTVLVFTLP